MSLTHQHHHDHQIECHRCGDVIEDWCERRRYGFWDADTQNYERQGSEEYYCRECWQENEGRTNGAHFWADSAQQLWTMLDAADGDLAAIPTWWTGRPSIRVVDGEPEAAVSKRTGGGKTADGRPIITFEAELIDGFDRDEFFDVLEPNDRMNLVLLRDPERTPFDEIYNITEGDDGE